MIAKINHEVKKYRVGNKCLLQVLQLMPIQLTGNALGFESFWATGPLIEGRELREAFGCDKNDKIVSLITN